MSDTSFWQALSTLEYPEKLQRLLLTPQREVVVELVITKDNGEIECYNAYRYADTPALIHSVITLLLRSDCSLKALAALHE
jgi:hypothetical protein